MAKSKNHPKYNGPVGGLPTNKSKNPFVSSGEAGHRYCFYQDNGNTTYFLRKRQEELLAEEWSEQGHEELQAIGDEIESRGLPRFRNQTEGEKK